MAIRIMTLLMGGLMCAAQLAHAESEKRECPIQSAMKKLPQLEYLVGATKTFCSKTAAELSSKEDVPVRFVIGKETYKSESAAMLALAKQTEATVKEFATPSTCEVSGKTALGGRSLACSKEAAATAALIRKAIDAVPVSYKVGDKESNCPLESKKLAEAAKTDVVFRVAGKETTCPVRHRINVARERYRAAVGALAKADSELAR